MTIDEVWMVKRYEDEPIDDAQRSVRVPYANSKPPILSED